jgi:hypothetical protein
MPALRARIFARLLHEAEYFQRDDGQEARMPAKVRVSWLS